MFKSIVVGTDGSATADKAVAEAIELTKANSATLHIVTAFQVETLRRIEREISAEEAAAPDMAWALNARDAVEARATEAVKAAKDGGIDAIGHAYEGSPADALIAVAEETDADLIVVGNKGMTGARRFVLSSVPNKVSHNAPCSVLIVQTT
jgi:nucleotide-binding universal stress UspA family protein